MKIILKKALILAIFGATCLMHSAEKLTSYSVEAPRSEGYLQVSDKHQLFYATYGNPNGIPVVVLHGGPGIGTSDQYSRYFDLKQWNVVMFDQRGAMRSLPFASMDENNTQNSVNDIESLRKHLGIKQWAVFGHSWGSCLALTYGQSHPESCLGFILEGMFLGRQKDISFFRDMGKTSPSAYEEFLTSIPKEERNDIPSACYQRLMDPNPDVHMNMARAIMRYQMLNSTKPASPEVLNKVLSDDRFILSFIRAFVHYAVNQCFLEKNQVLENLNKVTHLPAILVHGSLDTVCPPEQAYLVNEKWKNSNLWMIEGAGHSCNEPAIAEAITKATDELIVKLKASGT